MELVDSPGHQPGQVDMGSLAAVVGKVAVDVVAADRAAVDVVDTAAGADTDGPEVDIVVVASHEPAAAAVALALHAAGSSTMCKYVELNYFHS